MNGLDGLWKSPSLTFPDHDDFMAIDEDRGRIIKFIVYTTDPLMRNPLRSWFRRISANSIEDELPDSHARRVWQFAIDGDQVTWRSGNFVSTWTRVPWNQRPEWLDRQLAIQHSKLDAAEKSP